MADRGKIWDILNFFAGDAGRAVDAAKASDTDEEYLAQRRARGLSDAAFGMFDLPAQVANAAIGDVDYWTGGGLSGGTYDPYQFPMASQSAANLAAQAPGFKPVIPSSAVSPKIQQQGANQQALMGMIPTGLDDVGSLAMAAVPALKRVGKAADDLVPAVKAAQKLIVRDKGSNIGSDALAGLTREGHYYRGMTDAEFNATLGSGQGVKSNNEYSLKGEGTSFAGDAPTAESYVNYGRDDPRKTGKPNYLVEVRAGENIESKPDGYYHAREGLSPEQVQRVWRMEDNDGALVAVPHDLVPAVKAKQKRR
jgi:hypothetical protein